MRAVQIHGFLYVKLCSFHVHTHASTQIMPSHSGTWSHHLQGIYACMYMLHEGVCTGMCSLVRVIQSHTRPRSIRACRQELFQTETSRSATLLFLRCLSLFASYNQCFNTWLCQDRLPFGADSSREFCMCLLNPCVWLCNRASPAGAGFFCESQHAYNVVSHASSHRMRHEPSMLLLLLLPLLLPLLLIFILILLLLLSAHSGIWWRASWGP